MKFFIRVIDGVIKKIKTCNADGIRTRKSVKTPPWKGGRFVQFAYSVMLVAPTGFEPACFRRERTVTQPRCPQGHKSFIVDHKGIEPFQKHCKCSSPAIGTWQPIEHLTGFEPALIVLQTTTYKPTRPRCIRGREWILTIVISFAKIHFFTQSPDRGADGSRTRYLCIASAVLSQNELLSRVDEEGFEPSLFFSETAIFEKISN